MAGHRTLLWIGDPGSPGPNVVPINDMDVRVLKSLYIPGVTYALGVAAARVAGAHDLLEKNAQKLVQESNAALETYQRQRAAEQAETLWELEGNAALSAWALQLAQDAAAAEDELRTVRSVSEREQTQRLALLEEINLVQTENGSLRQQLRALGKL
ncbi:hypothetical protein DFH94DRAFT_696583 [Russula ochroleuca]|uniref:Uncharacterized protein n=1 Tax=Russula ochroleuca TaxID=152965 RepID=A0A9P5MMJ7_9AGAM|nr:hypothetical protein DFH94DRAFT_696583 [Russula ochroleuca]